MIPAQAVEEDKRTVYEQARARLQTLIDHPDNAVSLAEYRAGIQAAQKASQDAHDAWMQGVRG